MRFLALVLILFSTNVFSQKIEVLIKNESIPKDLASCKSNIVTDRDKNEVEIYKGSIEGQSGQFYSIYFYFGVDTIVFQGGAHYGSEKLYEKADANWINDTLLKVTFINPDTTESISLFGTKSGKYGLIIPDK